MTSLLSNNQIFVYACTSPSAMISVSTKECVSCGNSNVVSARIVLFNNVKIDKAEIIIGNGSVGSVGIDLLTFA